MEGLGTYIWNSKRLGSRSKHFLVAVLSWEDKSFNYQHIGANSLEFRVYYMN